MSLEPFCKNDFVPYLSRPYLSVWTSFSFIELGFCKKDYYLELSSFKLSILLISDIC